MNKYPTDWVFIWIRIYSNKKLLRVHPFDILTKALFYWDDMHSMSHGYSISKLLQMTDDIPCISWRIFKQKLSETCFFLFPILINSTYFFITNVKEFLVIRRSFVQSDLPWIVIIRDYFFHYHVSIKNRYISNKEVTETYQNSP